MPALTRNDLIGRVWTFGMQTGELFARNVVLSAEGFFLHHPSPNEDRWDVEDGALVILSRDGRVSCRMRPAPRSPEGRLWLEGEHVLGGPSGLQLALRETGIAFPVYLPWSAAYERFAEEVPFYYSAQRRVRGVNRIGELITIHGPAVVEAEACLPAGAFVSVGAYSYCHGAFKSDSRVSIGRYCSIAGDARPFGPSHPMDRVTTSVVSYDPASRDIGRRYGREDFEPIPYDQSTDPIRIEHDVWIGEGAMIKGGVTIGTGAVVAAGTIVTRDVPPYAIVAGVPARVVRMRFPEPLAARLLESRWWQYNFVDLPPCFDRPEAFLNQLDALRARNAIAPWRPRRIDLAEELLRLVPDERPRA
ncbi:CatB-related O-acetyltransferase [Rhizosaccharibacter radicis]|uniref:CatB-related O-acetyltransferase n=1 Tax=Rhizosaccharibacter radicis TaxID=2782605 RepID=UPI003BF4763E